MVFLEGFLPFDLSLHAYVHLPESCLGKQLLHLFWKVCTFITECCAAFHHMAAMSLGDVRNLSLQADCFSDIPWV